eukprot:446557-Prymnesium_polylepis.2
MATGVLEIVDVTALWGAHHGTRTASPAFCTALRVAFPPCRQPSSIPPPARLLKGQDSHSADAGTR